MSRQYFSAVSFGTKVCFVVFLMLMIKTVLAYSEDRQIADDAAGIRIEALQCENRAAKKQDAIKRENAAEKADAEGKKMVSEECRQIGEEPEISVLITDSDGGRTHKSLQFSAEETFSVTSEAGTDTFSAGEEVDPAVYFSEKGIDSCSVSLCNASGKVFYASASDGEAGVRGIRVFSLKNGEKVTAYPGTLLIYRCPGEKSFYLINRVKLESYLPGVVSSEMPDDFGLEALKAQAVCARSYAMYVLENEKKETAEKGAVSWNLVDTTDDQVYLSGAVDARAVTACEQTRGQILYQDEMPLKPHYYSTSWGMKADGAVFGGGETQFLEASAVLKNDSEIEEMNRDFISTYKTLSVRNSEEYASYDRNSPWFRWTCQIPLKRLSDRKISEIMVTERGTGGYVSELTVYYADGTAEQIRGAGSVRRELGFSENIYRLWDDSTRTGLSVLPSAFFYTDEIEEDDGIQSVTLHGGGFGHGFGMSQYGAAEMAEKGYDFADILAYYYEEAKLTENY